jgi:hypothetical protein
MSEATVGLLHPGEMGAAVGQCLAAAGHRVLWVPEGRSAASAARAAAAGLTAASGGLAGLVREADVIVSVCPPHAALSVARQVAALGVARQDAALGATRQDAGFGAARQDAALGAARPRSTAARRMVATPKLFSPRCSRHTSPTRLTYGSRDAVASAVEPGVHLVRVR